MPKKAVRFHADIIQAMRLGSSNNAMEPDDSFYDRRLLAAGDARFTMGAIPSSNGLCERGRKLPAFHGMDIRNTLECADIDAKSNRGDRQNEIHPNGNGYRKIANTLTARLHKLR